MKNRSRILVLGSIAIVLLLAVLWWLSGSISPLPPAPTKSPINAQQRQATPSRSSPSLTYQMPEAGEYRGLSDPRWNWWREMERHDPKFEWKMPINFYGKVIDQNGQPVQGAKVRFQWTDMSAAGTSAKFAEADAQGMFSLTNEKGKRLGVFVSKEGYHAVNRGRGSFEYAAFFEPIYHEPDPNKPVVFHMLKKATAEPMIQRGPTLLRARNDGTPTSLDLTTGRMTTAGSGSMAVRITKGPKTNNRFDWTATVEGVAGTGLIQSNDEFMVMAPAEGYQSQWTFSQKVTDEQYQSQFQTKFYVKTGDGKYARIEMRIIPEYNETAAVDLTVYLNPAPGSRNLEFDPNKVVQSP